MDHHPNARITHSCRAGVDLELELFTLAAGGVTDFDFAVATVINGMYGGGGDDGGNGSGGGGGGGGSRGLGRGPTSTAKYPSYSPTPSSSFSPPAVKMDDFVYDLPDELIATSPPTPRGSSRLLVTVPKASSSSSSSLSPSPPLQQHLRSQLLLMGGASAATEEGERDQEHADVRFRDLPRLLPEDAHLVFNESKVVPARCFANGGVEVMFLSPETSAGEVRWGRDVLLCLFCSALLCSALLCSALLCFALLCCDPEVASLNSSQLAPSRSSQPSSRPMPRDKSGGA